MRLAAGIPRGLNLRTGVPSCPPATTRVPVYAVRLVGDTVYVTATPTPAEELPA